MDHDAVTLTKQERLAFIETVTCLADPRMSAEISTALKTSAPPHMIDTRLPNLWRY